MAFGVMQPSIPVLAMVRYETDPAVSGDVVVVVNAKDV